MKAQSVEGSSNPIARWVAHTRSAQALARFASLAREMDAPLLAVKGVVTARVLYADVAERHAGDVDLRVRSRDVRSLARAAERAGLVVKRAHPRLEEHSVFIAGVLVELETAVGLPGLTRLSVDDLLERASESLPELGQGVRVPELHDHALLLALNAWKDAGAIHPWSLEDLFRIVRVPGFSADAFLARARDASVLGAVGWVALRLASRSPQWESLARRVGPASLPSFATGACMSWFAEHPSWPRLQQLVAHAGGDAPLQSARGLGCALAGMARRQLHRGVDPDFPTSATPAG